MRKLLLSLSALASTLTVSADTYPYLSFQTTDGQIQSFATESLTMTYKDGQLTVTTPDGAQTLDAAQLTRMFFATEASGIENIPLSADGKTDVYTTAGIHVGTFATPDEAKKAMQGGIYVIKQNGKTLKMTAQ